jgi:hypothetical protein
MPRKKKNIPLSEKSIDSILKSKEKEFEEQVEKIRKILKTVILKEVESLTYMQWKHLKNYKPLTIRVEFKGKPSYFYSYYVKNKPAFISFISSIKPTIDTEITKVDIKKESVASYLFSQELVMELTILVTKTRVYFILKKSTLRLIHFNRLLRNIVNNRKGNKKRVLLNLICTNALKHTNFFVKENEHVTFYNDLKKEFQLENINGLKEMQKNNETIKNQQRLEIIISKYS